MYRKFLRTQICMKTLGFCENADGKKPNITNLQMIIWQKALYHYFGCLYGKNLISMVRHYIRFFCHKKIELQVFLPNKYAENYNVFLMWSHCNQSFKIPNLKFTQQNYTRARARLLNCCPSYFALCNINLCVWRIKSLIFQPGENYSNNPSIPDSRVLIVVVVYFTTTQQQMQKCLILSTSYLQSGILQMLFFGLMIA